MRKLFTWAAARLVAAFALALCFATPLVSWADAITAVNPVTGETETYTYKFVGTDSVWNNTANWQDSNGSNPSAVPAKSDSNTWAPILFDQAENQSIAIGAALSVEGWNLRMGLYNGASVQLDNLVKLQSDTATWITVDSSSHCTIAHMVNKKLVGANPLCLYSANQGGIAWTEELSSSGNGSGTPLPFHYYLAGNGTVAYNGGIAAAAGGAHVIKQADITLSGTSQVSSKTLVSFTSSSITFTADAAIKVYDGTTLKETVAVTSVRSSEAAIQNTTSALTTDDAVGTCELVQCTDGIVLYYVDGDPSAVVAKTYKPSININFTSGTALSTVADVGYVDYAVPGTSWNNLIGNNGTLSTVTQVDSTGAASTVAGVGVTISGTRGYWTCGSVSAANDLRQGYIDDAAGANASPQVVVSGIPYYSYYAVVYFSNNDANVKFGYVTINGTNYKWDDTTSAFVECEGADTDSWGASSPTAWTEGGNYIVTPTIVNADGTFTVVGHRVTGARAGIAAIQIVEVPKTAEEGELVINVSGDTTYTVSEDATYTTVYVTGAGTLAFDGEGIITTTTLNVGAGATVPMGSSITPTTVVGAGTVVYDGVQPSTTLGFDDSANWFGTVWVKNIGSNGESSKVSTVLGTDTATATDNVLKDWGNENSSVKFTNVRGWTGTAVCPWTLILEDDSTNYAWYNNNGYAARSTTFAALKGSGTFYDKSVDNKPCRQKITFTDGSQFTGALYAEGKRVGLGGENTRGDAEDNNGTIEVVSGATATVASGKTWTAGTGSILVTGTLYANGTLAGTSTTRAVRGSGTVVFTGSAPSPTGDAWWKNSAWTGTVELNAVTAIAGWEFNNYGHSGSTLRLNNCRGWLKANYTCIPALEIGGTFTWNDGSSGLGNTFKVGTLKGSGTISIPTGGAPTAVWQITDDWSGFTGAVVGNNTDGRRMLVFGPTLPATVEAGEIYVSDGATLNLGNASATWWTLGKGFVVDGTVVSPNRDKWGGGTAMTLGDTGVLELTSTANTQDYKDYSGVTGTGTIKYSSTAGWRLFPDTSAKMPATTLTIQTELADSLIIACTNDTVIGNLAGSKNIRSDWGDNSANGRTLTVTQSKDTEWSGKFVSNRITQFNVNPGASTTGTLTLSGTQTVTVPAAINGSVNLTGTWVGATTVSGTFGGTGTLTGDLTFSEGATFKAFAPDDEDGLVVSGTVGYPAEGKVTVDVSAIEPEADVALIKAADLDASKFALAGAPEGATLEVLEGVLTLTVPHVTITVPSIANTTVTVKIGDNTIGTSSGDYNVAPDSVVTVTYAAVDGYEISGTTEYTIDTSKSETTFDPAGTTEVKQYVASITAGETTTKYTTLQAAIDAVAQNKDIVLLANEADGATVSREITFNVVPGEYTYGDIAAGGDYILTTTALEGKTRYSFAQAVIAVTINEVRTLYPMITALTGIEAANAGPIGTTIEILSGNPADYAEYLPMFDLNVETGVFTKVTDPVAAIYNGVIQVQVYRTLAEAVAAAENGQMVKLLDGIELESAAEIASGKSITIDLNGKTVAGPAGGYAFSNAGGVTIVGNGTVTGAGGIVTNTASGATVAISNGTYTVTGDLFGNVEGGTIAVSGGTYNKTIDDDFLAEGYEVTENNGTYDVRVDKGWIYEASDAPNYTGSWSNEVEYSDGKITIEDGNTYTANRPSAGQYVTIKMTLSFDDVNDDEDGYEGAKAAIRLGAGAAEGAYVFQLYTYEGSAATWTNATGFTPAVETDYNVLFVLDLTNKTYTASIVSGATTNVLTIGENVTEIPFACQGEVTPVQTIDFVGSGTVSSIEGSYEDAPEPEGFVENQVIGVVTLTSAQAAWLNGQSNYDELAAKIATMTAAAFNDAYLLNLDILDESYQDYQEGDFVVTDFAFETESETEYVVVEVTLERHGALDGGINGTLKLTGAMQLGGQFETKASATISDDDFSEGNTATLKLEKSGALFYKPVIE